MIQLLEEEVEITHPKDAEVAVRVQVLNGFEQNLYVYNMLKYRHEEAERDPLTNEIVRDEKGNPVMRQTLQLPAEAARKAMLDRIMGWRGVTLPNGEPLLPAVRPIKKDPETWKGMGGGFEEVLRRFEENLPRLGNSALNVTVPRPVLDDRGQEKKNEAGETVMADRSVSFIEYAIEEAARIQKGRVEGKV